MDGVLIDRFGAVLVLGMLITISMWLLNKLFPQVPASHSRHHHPTHYPAAIESDKQQRKTGHQSQSTTRRSK